ncbi:ABC transporter substrate-binding protein [Dehalococcoidia bacterium]|nr:ABC transporter substrate-binding protein [Dehalococcoidia bacterium]MCL0076326.1 ABC transporter substrate-binding protein [Dehalococcoidia bacterium]MCL0088382.1 ABC transporter substrate-binding protein [Dehalococcoidia bacterium]
MRKIDIELPLPVARVLLPKIKELAEGMEVIVRKLQQEEHDPLPTDAGDIPELTLTHQLSILKNRDAVMTSGDYESPGERLPKMRADLQELGFDDPSGYFKTMCLVPIVLIYNRDISDPPESWADLTDARWKGLIGAASPDVFRKVVRFYFEELLGDDAEHLLANITYTGVHIDVNLAVDNGELDIGIIPLPFARASRKKNVCMQWPREGALCLPQVIIHKKGIQDDTLKISEYLLSGEVQRHISEVGMLIPVDPNAPLPPELVGNKLNLFWKGWDWFIAGMNRV